MLVSFFKLIFLATSTSFILEWNCPVIAESALNFRVSRLRLLDMLNDMLWLRLELDAHEADSQVFNGPTVGSRGLSRKIDGVLICPFGLR